MRTPAASSGRFVAVYASGFYVMPGILAKALALVVGHLPLDLSRHAHHHARRRHFGPFRNHRAGRDRRSFSYLRAIQNHRADSNQAIVLDGASMQHRQMAHCYAVANLEREYARIAMQHRVVLDVAVVTDADGIGIAARSDIWPDAGAFADDHVSNHLGTGIDVSRSGNLGYDAAIGTNHD